MDRKLMSKNERRKLVERIQADAEKYKDQPLHPEDLKKYGYLAKEYVRHYHPFRYEELMQNGELMDVFHDVDKQAREMLDTVTERLHREHPRPIGNDYTELAAYELYIQSTAEEIVMDEVINQYH